MCIVENVYLWVIFVLVFWMSGVVDSMENMFWVWYYNGDLIIFSCDCCNIVWWIVWVSWVGFSDFVEVIDIV